jgi:hypothetical protein
MTLPGFNAGNALYKTSVDYRSRVTAVGLAGVVPQLVAPPATVCGPCVGFGYQVCHRCFGEPRRCLFFLRQC